MTAARAICILLLGSALSCTATVAVSRVRQPGMPCADANRVARTAMLRLGYQLEKAEPATGTAPGKFVGRRVSGYSPAVPEPGAEHTALIKVHCSNQGADLEAATTESFAGALAFRQKFPQLVDELARLPAPPPVGDAGPRRGVVVRVEPQWGAAVASELGADLSALGIVPVRIQIDNHTERAYGFEGKRVRLVTQEGERALSFSAEEITRRAGTEVAARLYEQRIADGELAPGASRGGYLYFPATTFRRATVILLDRASEETEGFSVEF